MTLERSDGILRRLNILTGNSLMMTAGLFKNILFKSVSYSITINVP